MLAYNFVQLWTNGLWKQTQKTQTINICIVFNDSESADLDATAPKTSSFVRICTIYHSADTVYDK